MAGPWHTLSFMRGNAPARSFDLDRPELTIGRDPSCDVVVDAPGVSRQHARLVRDRDGHLLHDLNSSNGTFVNDRRISRPESLSPGDRIRLGQSVELIYEAPPAAAMTMMDAMDRPEDSPSTATRIHSPADPNPAPVTAGVHAPADPMGRTVLGDVAAISEMPRVALEPPKLVVVDAGGETQTIVLTAPNYTLGRADDNDIVVRSPIVSRRHARLEREAAGGYRLVELTEAGNPLMFEGRPLAGPKLLHHGDRLRIGGRDPGRMVTLTYTAPGEAAIGPRTLPIVFGEKTRIQIGRDPGNDVVLNVPQVSRFHALVERVGQRYRLTDLRTPNGTFVNDERIARDVWLKPQDVIRIGAHRFVMGQDRLAPIDESAGLTVEAHGLNKWVRKDLNILQDISLAFQPREFIVVVGQSGGGKSTLVDAIAGYRPATHGRVLVNGTDVYRNFDAIRNNIGFVPQKDIIHMELTVYQALDYAAQLRMPADTTPDERHQRVMEVLEDLDLAHRKDVQISGLSGGQQKRVSIGVELLTKPGLFFLDEPTSGLDPGTETALMQLMRRLADQGRTIILITHATKNVMLADKVIFLARGGFLAWFGPPDEALKYFDQYRSERDRRAYEMEFDQIYAILDDPANGTPAEWADRYQAHPAYQQYVAEAVHVQAEAESSDGRAAQGSAASNARAPKTKREASSLRQLAILSARNLKILTRDKFSLALMLAAAPLVGLLDVVLSLLLGRNPFSPGPDGNVPNVMITLFLLTIYGVMVGGLAQMREIVKEQDIYKRERLVNLKIVPYVLSKVWVAALLALYQSAAYVVIHYIAFDMPGGALEFGLIYVTLVLATMSGMMLGLFSSALSPNANSAPLIVILLMIPQIVLGGALIPMPGAGMYVSGLTATRWAFEALMGITGVGSDVAADVCWVLPEEARDVMTLEQKAAAGCRCLGASIFDPNSCNFAGVGRFYDQAIDQSEPALPPEPGAPPQEPAFPEPPPEPENPDTVAIAEYFQQFKEWRAETQHIQDDYKAQVAAYQADLEVYQAQAFEAQQRLVGWQIGRAQAVEPAEALIGQIQSNFGWTFVDKNNPAQFWPKIFSTWMAELIMSSVLFGVILFLQQRKDVT